MDNKSFTILVIDDDEDDRTLFSHAVARIGPPYQFAFVEACREGVNEILKGDTKPDLIFLDHFLSDIDGLECLHLLKINSSSSDIPVVMLSGVNNEKVSREAERLGAISYQVKPGTFNELIDLIKWVLTKKLNRTIGNEVD